MINPFRSIENILEVSDERLKQISQQIHSEGCAVFYDQQFTEEQIVRMQKRFGDCEAPGLFMNPKDYPEIFLVTGKKVDGKKIGMFGDTELGWHSNGNSRHLIDKILISLYCIQEDINTTLSVCHTSKPFYDLSQDEQEYWKSIKIRLKFQNNTIYNLEDDDPELEFMSKNKGSIRSLVDRHPHTGDYYFYFPYHFIVKAWEGKTLIDHEKMIERLKPIIFRSKYQYHHIFKKGDLLLMDQFTSLHRRTPVLDNSRLLWRLASDFKNVYEENHEPQSALAHNT
jgi:taurine dioxygenase